MRAYLHNAFRVVGDKLLDDELSSSYSLTPDSVWLVRHLQKGRKLGQLAARVQAEHGLSYSASMQAVLELVAQLEALGAIVWRPAGFLDRLNLVWFSVGRRTRYPLTVQGSIRALAYAYLPVGFLVALPYVVLLWQVWDSNLVWLFASLPGFMLITFAMHEWGHMMAAHYYRARAVFLAGTGYMAVAYGRVAPFAMRRIAFAGPVCAVGGSLLFAAMLPLPAIRILFLGVAAVHAFHLLPHTADGNIIWRRV